MNRRTLLTGFAALLAAGAALAASRASRANPYYSGTPGDHFDGVRFFNPDGTAPGTFADLMRWQFSGERSQWPQTFPSPHAGAKPAARIDGDNLAITHVGHATFLIQTQGHNLVTDPVWSHRASPLSFAGPRRVNEPGIGFADLPKIDTVLLTHNHYDHMDMATLASLVARDDPLIITPLGNDTIVRKAIPAARTLTGDWGDVATVSPRLKIHFEPCHHWSARGMGDRRMALWCAFAIETPAGPIYHVGDTGFHDGINFRAAAAKFGGFRAAMIPIGAYEPRWFMKGQHINPAEAVDGMRECKAELALGHHWGTFQLTDEPIEAPLEALRHALAGAGVDHLRFPAMRPGQAVAL